MNLENKRRAAWAVNGIFSFLLAFFLYLTVLCLVLSQTVLREGFSRQILEESQYVSLLSEEIQDDFTLYGGVGGFEEAFWQKTFPTILSEETLEADVLRQFHSLYTGEATDPNVELVQSGLYAAFLSEAVQRGIAIDADKEEDLQSLAETCAEVYGEAVKIPYADRVGKMISGIQKPLYTAFGLFALLAILCAGVLVWLNRKSGRWLYGLYGGLAGTALLSAVLPLGILVSGKIEKIGIFSRAVYAFSTLFLTKTLYAFLLAAGILLLLAILFIMIKCVRVART